VSAAPRGRACRAAREAPPGLRGVVSLAAALALPLATSAGAPFPQRDLILFLTFAVILATLVGQGLTLAPLFRWLGVAADGEVARAALRRLDALAREPWLPRDLAAKLRQCHEHALAHLLRSLDPAEARRGALSGKVGPVGLLRNAGAPKEGDSAGQARAGVLVVERGPEAGRRIPLDRAELTVGRQADNPLVFADTRLSRRHARFERRGAALLVTDLGSANGTAVNGARLVAPRALRPGDVIDLGGAVSLRVAAGAAAGTATQVAGRGPAATAVATPGGGSQSWPPPPPPKPNRLPLIAAGGVAAALLLCV